MFASSNRMEIYVVNVFVILLLQCHAQNDVYTPETCVFEYDMGNRVKITCGNGAVLHIVDQHGNTLLTGETTNVADTPAIFQMNR